MQYITIIKQYLEISAIWPHCLNDPKRLQMSVKYLNIQFPVG